MALLMDGTRQAITGNVQPRAFTGLWKSVEKLPVPQGQQDPASDLQLGGCEVGSWTGAGL